MRTFIQWLAERAPFDPENDDPVDDPNYKPDFIDAPVDPEHFISFGRLPPEYPGQPNPKTPSPKTASPKVPSLEPPSFASRMASFNLKPKTAMAKPDATSPVPPTMAKPRYQPRSLPEVPELPKPVLPNPLPKVDSPVKRGEATKVMSKIRSAFLEKFGVPVSVGKEIIKRYGHPKHRAVDLYQYLANEPSIDVEEEVRVAKAQIAHDRVKYRGW